MQSSIDILIHTRNREDSLRTCIRSILGQSFHEYRLLIYDDASDIYNPEEIFSKEFKDSRIEWVRGEKVLGLIPSRNCIMKLARAEILICLDDDVVLTQNDFICKIYNHFMQNPDHVLLAPKIMDIHNGKTRIIAPFSARARRINTSILDTPCLVSYYCGQAYAIRRKALHEAGYISLKTSYGADELDLSYKLTRGHLLLYYRPDIVAVHEGQKFRKDRTHMIGTHIMNRVYLAYQYLPLPYCFIYVMIWLLSCHYQSMVKKTSGITSLYSSFLFAVIKGRKDYIRDPLGKKAINYLKNNYGRLWY